MGAAMMGYHLKKRLVISFLAVWGLGSSLEAVDLRVHVGPKLSFVKASCSDVHPFRGVGLTGTLMSSAYPFGFLIGADFDLSNRWDYTMPSTSITAMPVAKMRDFKVGGYRADPWVAAGITLIYFERPPTYPMLFPVRGGLLWHLSQDGFSRWTVVFPELTFSWFTYYFGSPRGYGSAFFETYFYLMARFGVGYRF